MDFLTTLKPFDFLLIGVVASMVCGVAYLKSPRLKTFFLFLPLPSLVITLSLDKPVDISFLLGLPLLAIFYTLIYVLYDKLGINIIVSIACAVGVYCLAGGIVQPFLSKSPWAFYACYLAILVMAVVMYRRTSDRREPEYQTPLPLYIKAPAVILIVLLLVKMKSFLSGFMAAFPMVGTVGAYETRHCLKTAFRQLPFFLIGLSSLLTVCFMTQPYLGLYGGLAAGWGVYFILLIVLKKMWLGPPAPP